MRAGVQALAVAWMAAAIGVLALLLCTGASCGGMGAHDPIRTHAQIAGALYEPINATKHIVEERAAREVREIRLRAASEADADAAILAVQKAYAPLEGALTAVIAAHAAYVDAVTTAHKDQTKVPAEYAMALLAQWRSMIGAAELLGLTLPTIPPYLEQGAASGQ